MLSTELGVAFRLHDDGSRPSMPDLVSTDGRHVAEVVTTALPAAREAERHLQPIGAAALPHCVWVIVPNANLGGLTKGVRWKIHADVLRWTAEPECAAHWSPQEDREALARGTAPILGLRAYDDGVRVMCVEHCQHVAEEPHQVRWTVAHAPTPCDPWELLGHSLAVIDKVQRGGIPSLAKKLAGYPNKHLVIYPFGAPGNLTAAISRYVLPADLRRLIPTPAAPELSDAHLWLVYRYENGEAVEGLHVHGVGWSRFEASIREDVRPGGGDGESK
jgi:hypothetical protein